MKRANKILNNKKIKKNRSKIKMMMLKSWNMRNKVRKIWKNQSKKKILKNNKLIF